MNKIQQFFDWVCDGLVRSSHARFGIFLPSSIVDQPKPVGLLFVFDELWPESSDDAREELLWMTPHPFVSVDGVAISLRAMRAKWGSKIGDAINGEMNEFDRIWEETRPQRDAWENEGGAIK